MDLPAITEALRAKMGADSGLGATLKFDCGADGCVYLDGRALPNSVSNNDREADCTIAITRENLCALIRGELGPATGFMTGKFTVTGDMSVALRLQRVM